MRQILFATIVALCLSTAYTLSLTGDFVTGFESGIFLRNNPKMFQDYGCPEPRTDNQQFRQMQSMIQPIKMMSGMLADKNIEQAIQTIEVFINSLASLMAVFDGYDGGDFCSGLIFGMNGAGMLTQVATTAFDMILAPKTN